MVLSPSSTTELRIGLYTLIMMYAVGASTFSVCNEKRGSISETKK